MKYFMLILQKPRFFKIVYVVVAIMERKNIKIIFLNEVESTNNYANSLILSDAAEEGTVVLARYQTQGKGQQGNHWESEAGKNLLMSLIMYPRFLPAGKQFLVSKIVSLAITDWLQNEVEECTIKWPNDIYIGDRKVAGILIENTVKGQHLFSSVIGIGMNVNQLAFKSDAPNPVSLQQVTGKSYDIEKSLDVLLAKLNYWYSKLVDQQNEEIDEAYFLRLYRRGKWSLFSEPGKLAFEAWISGIGKFGQLQLKLRDGTSREFMFKKVEFI